MKVKIDPEFAKLIPDVAHDEDSELEREVLRDGRILNPLIVWDHNNILLDGHRRHRLTIRHPTLKIPAPIVMHFESRQEAHDWIIRHQLSKRNTTAEQRRYLIGKLYSERKRDPAENLKKGPDSPVPQVAVSEQLAKENNISVDTVQRAAHFAEAVDAVAEVAPEIKAAVLSGEVKATTADLEKVAELSPAKAAAVARKITSGQAKSVKAALPPKPARGQPKIDVRKFEKAKANVGKIVREMTDLKEHAGGATFHETIRKALNEILTTVDAWRKAVLK
jgi:hypothetical protein